jgi:hypothetical protein
MDRSPCLRCLRLEEDKMECSEECRPLAAYQEFLGKEEGIASVPGIDYSVEERGVLYLVSQLREAA